MSTMSERYGCKFMFTTSKEAPKIIIKLLSERR
jgi:hypothetical protein